MCVDDNKLGEAAMQVVVEASINGAASIYCMSAVNLMLLEPTRNNKATESLKKSKVFLYKM